MLCIPVLHSSVCCVSQCYIVVCAVYLCIRYAELEERYGRLEPLVDVDLSVSHSATVTVNFNGQTSLRTIDLSLSLEDTRRVLAKKLGLQARQIVIYHLDVGAPYGSELMMYPKRLMRSYKVKEGDELTIQLR